MLHVLCRIGRDAYAISSATVERILPFAALKNLPGAEHGLTGILNYQGRAVPVVDLCLLLTGSAAREILNTRILLCPFPESSSGRIGLVVEGVTEARKLEDRDFHSAGATGAPCLDDVAATPQGLIQRIELPGILPVGLLASLGLPAEISS